MVETPVTDGNASGSADGSSAPRLRRGALDGASYCPGGILAVPTFTSRYLLNCFRTNEYFGLSGSNAILLKLAAFAGVSSDWPKSRRVGLIFFPAATLRMSLQQRTAEAGK